MFTVYFYLKKIALETLVKIIHVHICKIEFMLGIELLTLNVGVKSKPI